MRLSTVDDYIQELSSFCNRPNWKLFEPSDKFYSGLLSGEDSDLYEAAKVLAEHIDIPPLRSVSYEWGLVAESIFIRLRKARFKSPSSTWENRCRLAPFLPMN